MKEFTKLTSYVFRLISHLIYYSPVAFVLLIILVVLYYYLRHIIVKKFSKSRHSIPLENIGCNPIVKSILTFIELCVVIVIFIFILAAIFPSVRLLVLPTSY